MIPYLLAAVGGYLLGDSMKDSEKFAEGGNVGGLKNYNVTGTFYLYYTKLDQPITNNPLGLRDYEEKSFEKSVMATSQDEAEDIAIDEIMEEHQGYVKYADIYVEDVVETGRYADGGTIGAEGFTISQMKELLNQKFPYSFGFELYPQKKGVKLGTPDYDAVEYGGLKDADIKQKIYFPQYKRDHSINYEIMEGEENTYFHFLLEGENGDGYVGGFGFKDRGDVGKEYVTGFLAFLQEQYGLPFQIEHKVMAKGGDIKMDKGGQVAKKAILIDSYKETITEITISNSQDIYDAIDAELFEIVNIDNKNDLYVDEEGLFRVNAYSKFFTYGDYPQPLIGNGIVLGYDSRNGNSRSTTLSVEEVKKQVKFLTLDQVRNG